MVSLVLTASIDASQIEHVFASFPRTTWGWYEGVLSIYDSPSTQEDLNAVVAALPSVSEISLSQKKAASIEVLRNDFKDMCRLSGWLDTANNIRIPFSEDTAIRFQLSVVGTPVSIRLLNTGGVVAEYSHLDVVSKGTAYLIAYRTQHNNLWTGVNDIQNAPDEASIDSTLSTYHLLFWN